MKARIGVLVVLATLAVTAWFQNERGSAAQRQAVFKSEQAEQAPQEPKKASAEAYKAYALAKAEAERTWKIATQIRERDGIMDPAPHRESNPISASGNPDDLKAYLTAKKIYLKANGESAAKGDLAFAAARIDVDERRKPLEEARAKVEQTSKAAAALRQEIEIIDPDPESETTPTSLLNNPDAVKSYLTAKREYLKAKAELQKLEAQGFYSLSK